MNTCQILPIISVLSLFAGALLTAVFEKKKVLRIIFPVVAAVISFVCMVFPVMPVMIDGEIITFWLGNRSVAGKYSPAAAMEVDALSLFFGLILSGAVLFSILCFIRCNANDGHVPLLLPVFLALAGSILGLVLSGNLFLMFLMMEVASFSAIAMMILRNRKSGRLEAALEYLVISRLGSAAALAGIIILYVQARTLNFAGLSALIPQNMNAASKLAFAFLFVGFSIVTFSLPFYSYSEATDESAPPYFPVLVLDMIGKSGLYVMIRLSFFVFQTMQLSPFQFLFGVVGCAVMLIFAIRALNQRDLAGRLMCHSISRAGSAVAAMGLCTALGASAGFYQLMSHTLVVGLLFLVFSGILRQTGTSDLNELGGLSAKMPRTMFFFLVGTLSISGIPPLNGFACDRLMFQAVYKKAVETGNFAWFLPAMICLLTSLLTLASLLKVFWTVFFGGLPEKFQNVTEVPSFSWFAMGILASFCVISGLFPDAVGKYLTQPAATAVFNVSNYIDSLNSSTTAGQVLGEISAPAVDFSEMGVWSPVLWIVLLTIAVLGVAVISTWLCSRKFSSLTSAKAAYSESDAFSGREEIDCSAADGTDLFQKMKAGLCRFSAMFERDCGIIHNRVLLAAAAFALMMLFMLLMI